MPHVNYYSICCNTALIWLWCTEYSSSVVNRTDILHYNPPIIRAILLASLRHVVQIYRTVITQLFPLKRNSQRKKSQLKSFIFSSLLFNMEEKQTRFVDVQSWLHRSKSWSQMLLRKVQKCQQNMLSTS